MFTLSPKTPIDEAEAELSRLAPTITRHRAVLAARQDELTSGTAGTMAEALMEREAETATGLLREAYVGFENACRAVGDAAGPMVRSAAEMEREVATHCAETYQVALAAVTEGVRPWLGEFAARAAFMAPIVVEARAAHEKVQYPHWSAGLDRLRFRNELSGNLNPATEILRVFKAVRRGHAEMLALSSDIRGRLAEMRKR